jgi:hypothetical protein
MDRQFLAETYGLVPYLTEREKIDFFLQWNAGLVIAGLKPASLIRLPADLMEGWKKYGKEMCSSRGLTVLILQEKVNWLFLIYRRNLLRKKIETGISSRYLALQGYPCSEGLDHCLAFLRERFEKPRTFPHEVGIFLGYPTVDVIGFSTGKLSPYNYCGYWKVYHHPERARRTFAYMDKARIQIIRSFFTGREREQC